MAKIHMHETGSEHSPRGVKISMERGSEVVDDEGIPLSKRLDKRSVAVLKALFNAHSFVWLHLPPLHILFLSQIGAECVVVENGVRCLEEEEHSDADGVDEKKHTTGTISSMLLF